MMITTTFSEIQYFNEKTGVTSEILSLRSFLDYKRNYFAFKRIGDFIFSLFVIVFVLSWLIPIIAILIKLDSWSSVFFAQRRVGRWGRTFPCLKFRTMIVNQYANTEQARENDSRITTVGKFLRKSNLNEFPQFINVLLGHMAIVGPRPHMHSDCDRFSKVISNYKFRNLIKPGITGLAQIKGYRGPTRVADFPSHCPPLQAPCKVAALPSEPLHGSRPSRHDTDRDARRTRCVVRSGQQAEVAVSHRYRA